MSMMSPCLSAGGCSSSSGTAVKPLRAVFMGTPGFAAVIFERMLSCPEVDVVALYCQPDRPAGRGKAMKMPETKEIALQRGIPVEQPLSLKNPAVIELLKNYKPDVLLVAAYGLLLPQAVLDIPTLMPMNVHASLLPLYRGAAPIQRSIMAGDAVTGITIMRMEAGLDTGPILLQRAVGIDINDTSATLHDELAQEGATLLAEALTKLRAGTLCSVAQEDAKSTHAPKLAKAESRIDLRLTATTLHAHLRGLAPWPGSILMLRREGEADLPVHVGPGVYPQPEGAGQLYEAAAEKTPGTILGVHEACLVVACGDGCYSFSSICPSGKKPMDGRAFTNGYLAGFASAVFLTPE